MNRTIIAAPRFVTYTLLVVAVLAGIGWVRPYFTGPDISPLVTVYRDKPVPVQVETVKWMTKVEKRIVRETVNVPIEVIRELPAKQAARISEDFKITLPELRATNRELVDVLDIPKAPHGGEMAITANTNDGKIEGIFRANRGPFIEIGGLREAGVEYEPLNAVIAGYYRQDLIRVGPAVLNGRAFAATPGTARASPKFGVAIGVAVRF